MSDQERRLGHIVSVKGSKLTGFLSADGGTEAEVPGEVPVERRSAQFGGLVKMKTRVSTAYGMICGMWITNPGAATDDAQKIIEVELFGEIVEAKDAGQGRMFQRGVSVYPGLGADIFSVTSDDLALIYARPHASNVRIGAIHQDRNLPAFVVTDRLLGKHFAVLGTTGSGKSCTTALILQSILKQHPNGHLVVLDPHNEYGAAFGDTAEVVNPSNLELPYWLLNFEESVAAFVTGEGPDRETEKTILNEAILEARKKYAGADADAEHITVDTPVPYRLGEIQRIIQNCMGRLEKAETSRPYLRLHNRIEALSSDPRFAFMFSGVIVRDCMADILSRLLRIPVDGRPVTIFDLSGVPSEIVDVVVSVLCRMIFDFAVWSAKPKAAPVLLVCEEAHRYVPQDENLGFGPTRRCIARIAKEGRKYGVSLCLVSQRPSELSTTILSQCNTIFALRMCNDLDQDFVRTMLPDGADGLLAALPSLHNQEAIAVGEGVTVPMRLCLDTMKEACRPKSGTASFSTTWQEDTLDKAFVRDTMDRWRRQQRKAGPAEAA